MKKFMASVLIAINLVFCIYAQDNSVKLSPQKPKSGDEVTITFNAVGTPLAKAAKVEMSVYLCSSKIEKQSKIEKSNLYPMVKKGNTWEVKFKTLATTDFAAFIFGDGNNDGAPVVNNEGKGFFVKFYDKNGKETLGSKIGYASCIGYLGSQLGLKIDNKKAFDLMNEIFTSYPEFKTKYLMQYYQAITAILKPEESDPVIQKELDVLKVREDLSDEAYAIMAFIYTRLKLANKAEEVTNFAIKKYPTGDNAFSAQIAALRAEKDFEKQIDIAAKLQKDFSSNERNYWGYLIVAANLLKENKIEMLKDLLAKNSGLMENEKFDMLFLNNMLEANKELEIAETIAAKGVLCFKKEMEKPLTDNTDISEKKQALLRKNNYGNILVMYGVVLSKLNKKVEAVNRFDEAFMILATKDVKIDVVELYSNCLVENKNYDKAQKVIEETVRLSIANDKLKVLLKEVYLQKKGSDQGYVEYLSALENAGKSGLVGKLKKEMIKEKAPQFTLKDLDGKTVSLSDYKGKIVIIDFWATWCVPCKASFPGMQKAVEKFAKDDGVKFLFVDTYEKVENKTKNALDFINQNKYSFHVLVDERDAVVKSFNINGVPTKIVVDKEGSIRFKIVGAPEGADAIVEEVSTIIELVR